MKPKVDENGSLYYDSLDECKPEYISYPCWSTLQFYILDGRKSKLERDNFIPIKDLLYTVYASYDKRLYVRQFRNYPLIDFFPDFYYGIQGIHDEGIVRLHQYIFDGTVTLLFTKENMADIVQMLSRVYKSLLSGEGTFENKDFISLLDQTLKYEHYKDYGKNLVGFKTVCNQIEQRIAETLQLAHQKNNKPK